MPSCRHLVSGCKATKIVCCIDILLLVYRNPDTLKRRNDTEKRLKERRDNDYINLDLSNEEREKGNEASACLSVLEASETVFLCLHDSFPSQLALVVCLPVHCTLELSCHFLRPMLALPTRLSPQMYIYIHIALCT